MQKPSPLVRTYMNTLAFLIGGIGGIGAWFGTELWHLAVGLPLVLLAAVLIRLANHGG